MTWGPVWHSGDPRQPEPPEPDVEELEAEELAVTERALLAEREAEPWLTEWPAFRCRGCGADFDEVDLKSDDNEPRCPDCGSRDLVDHRP